MRILHIGKYYPPMRGGMETLIRDIAEQQVSDGHQVTVWVHNHAFNALTSKTEESTVEINGQPLRLIRQKSTRPILFTPFKLGVRKTLRRLVREWRPDVVHVHWPSFTAMMPSFTRALQNTPLVISWHSDIITEGASWGIKMAHRVLKPLQNRLLRRADAVIASSEEYLRHSNTLPAFSDRCVVIPLGVRPRIVDAQAGANVHWRSGALRIYSLGRLTFYKNHALLIRAAAQMPEVQVKIAGGGQLHGALQQLIERLDCGDRVELLGEVDQATADGCLASCDAFCFPSNDRAESFGLALLEAMHNDKVAVISDTPGSGMRWLAEEYPKSIRFSPNDTESLIQALQKVRDVQSEWGQKNAGFRLDIAEISPRLVDLYRRLIAAR